ncbi:MULTISPECIES: hypothetical protein [Bacillus]|uniref:hypothetical protein n=1 Tax=Bacillus TaxID=1386 RepID=UPI000988EFA0|nr:hypothetical protein [Bacillus subtilis]OOE22025.1 hypothetical protein BSR82_04810 [Bacillus subtilis]
MENVKGIIEVLSETRKEIDSKIEKLNELKREQIKILEKKLEEHKEVINWYIEQHLNFAHPVLEFHNSMGPILGYKKDTQEVIFYHARKEGLFAQEVDESVMRPALWWDIIDYGQFENAIKGFDYLLTLQNEHLTTVNNDIKRIEAEIQSSKK